MTAEQLPEPEKRLVSSWEMMHKDNEGEAHVTELHKYEYEPDLEDVEQHFITQAAPTIIRPTRRKTPIRRDSLTLAAGDAQIGFRGDEPFHDEHAMSMFQIAVRELQPDFVTFTGDMLDLPAQGRYEQRPDWQHKTQDAIDRYHQFLAQTRANAPNARIIAVHGNHELRQETMIRRDAAELLGLRRANADQELGVLTLQYLCRYEELEVEGIDGWPNATFWLENNLQVTHGTETRKGNGSALSYLGKMMVSTVFGHDHRLQMAHRTWPTRDGHEIFVAASPGCLARVDGAVPGRYHSTDARGQLVPRAQDWQNGGLAIEHNAKHHNITPFRIDADGMNLWGKHYD